MDCTLEDVDDFEDNVISPINSSSPRDWSKSASNVVTSPTKYCSNEVSPLKSSCISKHLNEENFTGPGPSSVLELRSGENSKFLINHSDTESDCDEDKEILRPKSLSTFSTLPKQISSDSDSSTDNEKQEENAFSDAEHKSNDDSIDDRVSVSEEDLVIDYTKVGRWTNSTDCLKDESKGPVHRETEKKTREINEIHDETQRIIRENYIELPKHEPKQCLNLKEFKEMLANESEADTVEDSVPNSSEIDFSIKSKSILDLIPKEILVKPVKMSADDDGFISFGDDEVANPRILDLKQRFQKQLVNPSIKFDNLSIAPARNSGQEVIKGKKSWKLMKEKLQSELKNRRLTQYEDKIKAERAERGDENWTVDQSEVEKIYKNDDSSTDEDYNAEDSNDSDVTISDESECEDEQKDEKVNELLDEECEESDEEIANLADDVNNEVDVINKDNFEKASSLNHNDESEEEDEDMPIFKKKQNSNKLFADDEDGQESAHDDFEDLNQESISINFNVPSTNSISLSNNKNSVNSMNYFNSEMDLFCTQCSQDTQPEKTKSCDKIISQSPYELFFSSNNNPVVTKENSNNSQATTVLINKSDDSLSTNSGSRVISTIYKTSDESATILIDNKTLMSEKTIMIENDDSANQATQLIDDKTIIIANPSQDPAQMMTQILDENANHVNSHVKCDGSPGASQKSDETINDSQIMHDKRRELFDTDDLNGLSEIEEGGEYESSQEADVSSKECSKEKKKTSRVLLLDDNDEEDEFAIPQRNRLNEKKNYDQEDESENEDSSKDVEEEEEADDSHELDEEDLLAAKIKPKKSKRSEFYEDEAELSGSEEERKLFGDHDEVEDIDKQIAELKEMAEQFIDDDDDKRLDKRKIRKQLDKLYQRMEHDRDIREIKRIKEMLFEEGDLYNGDHAKRTRKFRWLGLDDEEDFFLKFSDEESDDDDEDTTTAEQTQDVNTQRKSELMSQWLKRDLPSNNNNNNNTQTKKSSQAAPALDEDLINDGQFDYVDKQIEHVSQAQNSIDSLVTKLGIKTVESLIQKVKTTQRNPLKPIDNYQKKRQSFLKTIDRETKQKGTLSNDPDAPQKLDEKTTAMVKNYNLQQKTSLSCFQVLDTPPDSSSHSQVNSMKKMPAKPSSVKRPLNDTTRPGLDQASKKLKASSIFTAMKTK